MRERKTRERAQATSREDDRATELGGEHAVTRKYLVSSVDVSANGRSTGLQHIGSAQRGGGHGRSSVQPTVLLQIRQFEAILWIHCEQTFNQREGKSD